MERIIRAIKKEEWETCLDFVERVFTDSEDAESGRLVRNLMSEIRSNRYYVPELDLVMLNREGEIIGQTMFSRFHLEGGYEDELLILTPVAVKTELQRQHISKELIEFGLNRARELGFTVCIVEGNPQNYRPRGFRTSADYGIFADAEASEVEDSNNRHAIKFKAYNGRPESVVSFVYFVQKISDETKEEGGAV